MSSKSTLIFVPGSSHTTEYWNKVIALLSPHYKCIAVNLPSTTNDNTKGLGDDVEAVRSVIITETTRGLYVVLVAHSFRGLVAQSSIKGLSRPKDNSSSPKSGCVIGIALIATGFGITGISFIDGLGGKPPPTWRTDPSGFAVWNVEPQPLFYHDLPADEAALWASKLTKLSLKSVMEGGEFVYAG